MLKNFLKKGQKTPNRSVGKNLINFTWWKDSHGFFIFPTIMWDGSVPITPDFELCRCSLFWGRLRFNIDYAKRHHFGKFDWDKSGLSAFLKYLNKHHRITITKEQMLALLERRNDLKKFLTVNNAQFYYVQRYLFQQLAKQLERV